MSYKKGLVKGRPRRIQEELISWVRIDGGNWVGTDVRGRWLDDYKSEGLYGYVVIVCEVLCAGMLCTWTGLGGVNSRGLS